jgi:hypothetical protein
MGGLRSGSPASGILDADIARFACYPLKYFLHNSSITIIFYDS